MPPTLQEMLNVAKQHDAMLHSRNVKINKAIQQAGEITPAAVVPVHELDLRDEDSDPFNGNLNNRRVAARIARDVPRKSANHHDHFMIGNPEKAAADVAKSLAVMPDPVIASGDELPPIVLPKPSAGSPAAAKRTKAQQKAAEKANAAPPTWGAGTTEQAS